MGQRAWSAALTTLLALAACHSSGGSSSSTSSPTTSSTLSSSSSPPASSSTSSSSSTLVSSSTSTTAASTRCHTSQVDARIDSVQGAAGTIGVTFRLVNTSPSTCTFQGYAGIGLRDAAGNALADPVRDPNLPGGVTISLVTVAPGAAGTFLLTFSQVPSGTAACPMATKVLVTPPDETASQTVTPSAPFMVCGNARVGPITHA